MSIRKASFSDLDRLYELTCSCGNHLMAQGIFQWNENYPSRDILENDIAQEQLWVLEENNTLIGLVVLTEIMDEEYKEVEWLTPDGRNLYIHRLAVEPTFQGKGFAQRLMDHAEAYATENQYVSIRLDTFSQNRRNQQFYEKRNYRRLGNVYFTDQSEHPFYCYERVLQSEKK